MTRFSVVIPTYNEGEGIEKTIRTVIGECNLISSNFEILIVDDNSKDNTRSVVEQMTTDVKVLKLINRTEKRSLGASVGEGIRRSLGITVIVMDADLTHNPKHILELLVCAENKCFALGSRFVNKDRGMLSRRHYWASRLFSLFVKKNLELTTRDNLSGYFAVKKDYVLEMPFSEIFFGYGDYFFRLLFYTRIQGLRLCEHSIRYSSRKFGRSKSRFAILAITYTRALLKFKKTSITNLTLGKSNDIASL